MRALYAVIFTVFTLGTGTVGGAPVVGHGFTSAFGIAERVRRHLDLSGIPLVRNPKVVGRATLEDSENRRFGVSVVDPEYVQKLFEKVAKDDKIPYKFADNGCYARAHQIARTLEASGVITGKYFLGAHEKFKVKVPGHIRGEVEWDYHVASLVMVREKNGTDVPYIIDPSLFTKAVPVKEWIAKISGGDKKNINESFATARYHYKLRDVARSMSQYDPDDLEDMVTTLERQRAIQSRRDKGEEADETVPLGPGRTIDY